MLFWKRPTETMHKQQSEQICISNKLHVILLSLWVFLWKPNWFSSSCRLTVGDVCTKGLSMKQTLSCFLPFFHAKGGFFIRLYWEDFPSSLCAAPSLSFYCPFEVAHRFSSTFKTPATYLHAAELHLQVVTQGGFAFVCMLFSCRWQSRKWWRCRDVDDS